MPTVRDSEGAAWVVVDCSAAVGRLCIWRCASSDDVAVCSEALLIEDVGGCCLESVAVEPWFFRYSRGHSLILRRGSPCCRDRHTQRWQGPLEIGEDLMRFTIGERVVAKMAPGASKVFGLAHVCWGSKSDLEGISAVGAQSGR